VANRNTAGTGNRSKCGYLILSGSRVSAGRHVRRRGKSAVYRDRPTRSHSPLTCGPLPQRHVSAVLRLAPNTGLLLAPLEFPALRKKISYRHGLAEHTVTVEPEGYGAGRLQVVWERAGLLAKAEPHLPAIGRVVGPGLKRVRGMVRGLVR
jgi:hypothetical protein